MVTKSKQPKLRLVEGARRKSSLFEANCVAITRPTVREGGLFSEAIMPIVEEDAITDPDIFFSLPMTISLLHEQIEIGNLSVIAAQTGYSCDEIKGLLQLVAATDCLKLKRIRFALGAHRARKKSIDH